MTIKDSIRKHHKICDIIDHKFELLSISRDHGTQIEEMHPVLLYVPNRGGENHYHIELTNEEAKKLRDWLNEYFTT
jgi:hypothetical protein